MARVVVVGAGVAGLTFAHSLARTTRDTCEIVLLESGPHHRDDDQQSMDNPEFTHRQTSVIRTHERGPEWYPRGRGVGGGSLINGRLAMSGVPADWNAWATEFGVAGWTWATVDAHMRHVPTVVVDQSVLGVWATAIAAASRTLGWRVMPTRLFARRLENETVGAVHENTHVEKLLVEGGRVRGVRTISGWEVEADHVVLAAGALESPRLVLASELREVISIKGLMDHPALCFAVHAPGSNHHGVGLVLERDDMQIITMHEGDRVTIVGAALRVFSRGHVELHGRECHFDFRMLDDPRDVLLLGRCLEDMIQLALGSGASVTCGTEQTSLERVRSMTVEERISWMRRNVSGNWHAACSLPMGGGTLVDHNGRVRDTPNLWCCDASVMCDLPRATTQLPVMAVAAEIGKRFAINCEPN